MNSPIRHAISIDVEDWYQSTFDAQAALSDRFERSTMIVLEALAQHNVQGTFFVLGLAAEKAPGVVKAIAGAGHEIQSHGYSHLSNFDLSQEAFRQDVIRAKRLLEDMVGCEIYAYRAPCFTIDQRNMWVLDILAETGHRYDSSVFPVKTSRYGIEGYPPEPRIVSTGPGLKIVEAPVACFDWFGRRLAAGGGGYFRLWPYWLIRKAWQQIENQTRPGIVYMHPYEYDPMETNSYKHMVSWRERVHQGLGRKGFPKKVDRLLREFRFGTMSQVLAGLLKDCTCA